MRYLEYVVFAMLIAGMVYVLTVVFKVLAVVFGGMFPIRIDLTLVRNGAVVVLGALVVALCISVFLRYIPGVVVEGEEI